MNYNQRIIEFFKRHNLYEEEMFKYLSENSMMIDYQDDDQRAFIGCYYILNKKGVLERIQLNIPYVYDDATALINVHEIVHGIIYYKKLGKKIKIDVTVEALPMLYEKLYILENPSEAFIKYGEYLDSIIKNNPQKEYKFGLDVREELLKEYDYNMKKMSKKVKRLSRKLA